MTTLPLNPLDLTTLGSIGHKPEADSYPQWGGVKAVEAWHRLGATAFDCDCQISVEGTAWAVHWLDWWNHGIVSKPGTHVPRLPINRLRDDQIRNLVHREGWAINTIREVLEAAAALGITVCIECKSDRRFEEQAIWKQIKRDAQETGCRVAVMTIQNYPTQWRARARLRAARKEGFFTLMLGRRRVLVATWWPVVAGVKSYPWPVPDGVVKLWYSAGRASKWGASCGPGDARKVTAAIVRAGGVTPYPPVRPTPIPKPSTHRLDPAAYFVGAHGEHVKWLANRLVAHGYKQFYRNGTDQFYTAGEDRRAVAAFQRAQGWTGSDADGLPGVATLALLAAAPAK